MDFKCFIRASASERILRNGIHNCKQRRLIPMISSSISHFLSAIVSFFGFMTLVMGTSLAQEQSSWIRVNQLGYLPGSIKVAVLVSKDSSLHCQGFEVRDVIDERVVFSSKAVKPRGPYGPFASSWLLPLSGLKTQGSYYIEAAGVRSPAFRINRDIYDGTADFVLKYMRQQRCGYNPFLKDSCHTRDGYIIYHPTLDSTFIDVVGGWHDASDYLQYVTTSANAVEQMLFAFEHNKEAFSDFVSADGSDTPNGIPDILDEARWGLEWLLKMNPAPEMMFNQIADDRDHLGFRLPSLDTVNYGRGKERPVYFCTGAPQGLFQYKNRATGIASTAGKFASAFAMGSMIFREVDPAFASKLSTKAIDAYAFGKKHPGVCQTAPCRAPYFYEEGNWVDDMELAAAQLGRLTGEKRYLDDIRQFGAQEPITPWMSTNQARHYEWYPFVNLGHYYASKLPEYRREFSGYMRDGLDSIFQRGKSNPFLFGVPFIWCSNNLVAAAVTQARLYREQSGDARFAEMEASLRDWLFGCNPWGTSMIVGLPKAGTSPRDPHSAFSHVNHFPIDGGLIDGPVYNRIFSSLKGVRLAQNDKFADFQSNLAVYHDDWADYSSNEPTMDGTASLTYYLSASQKEGGAGNQHEVLSHGATVRLDTTKRVIYLVFTGHEFAEGGDVVRKALKRNHVQASFFFTGDFYRNPAFASLIKGLKQDGHYLGPHSDKHLLYASWNYRDSLLVSREEFVADLKANYAAIARFGITPRDARTFLPPYEWYNNRIADWCSSLGTTLVNFTPGTGSNTDYTTLDMGSRYVSSDTIFQRILRVDRGSTSGLNGHILLLHVGAGPNRTDKFFDRLDRLIRELKIRGYAFRRF
jgi:endoglucanase